MISIILSIISSIKIALWKSKILCISKKILFVFISSSKYAYIFMYMSILFL